MSLRLREPDLVARAIEMFVFEHVNRTQGAVIGLSGGIDSALTLSLAVRAMGPERILGLLMPDADVTNDQDMKDARQWAEQLGVATHTIPINSFVKEFNFTGLGTFTEDRNISGNLKARIRMVLSYTVANLQNRVVLGTGNRSELLLGYFTKFGDGAADLLPIGALYKTQVFQLAKHFQMPIQFLDKPPSADLWEGQTDKKELGASYEIIDPILYELVERRRQPHQVIESLPANEALVRKLVGRMEANQHKSEMPPIADVELTF